MDNSKYLKSFLLIYLVSLSGFTSTLVNDKLKQKIAENRFAQHIVGVTTVLVLMNLLGVDRLDTLLCSSILVYLGFLLTTKLSLNANIFVLILFLIGYLTEVAFSRKTKQLQTDPYVDSVILRNNKNKQNKIRIVLGSLIGVVVLYGCIDSYTQKETELKGGFNPIRFFMDGKQNDFMSGGGQINYKI